MIYPTGNALVVKPIPAERVTKGGIVIPETEAKKKDIAGVKMIVVSKGPLAFDAEMRHEKEFGVECRVPRQGDTILIGKYAGYNVEVNGEEYRVIWDDDVAAILEEDDE